MLLQNKVALITGAGSGIGRACALTFAADGARVAVLDYDRDSAEETAVLVRQAGGEALAIHANVAKEAEQHQAVSDCLEHFGALHCAVNNAALGGGFAPLTEFEEKRWQLAQDVTLKGVWLGMKYQIPAMLAAGGGAIVNIASLSGVRGEALQIAYSAAKGGVLAATRTAAAEFAQRGVRVNAINPGAVRTPALQMYFDSVADAEAQTAGVHAMRRVGEPHEIADAAAYLCSDRASFITGAHLDVDGGVMVNPHTL